MSFVIRCEKELKNWELFMDSGESQPRSIWATQVYCIKNALMKLLDLRWSC